jgi:hypothetical protein
MNVSCNGYAIDNNRPIRPLYVGTAIEARERDFSIRKGKLWLGDRRVNYVFPMHKMPVAA